MYVCKVLHPHRRQTGKDEPPLLKRRPVCATHVSGKRTASLLARTWHAGPKQYPTPPLGLPSISTSQQAAHTHRTAPNKQHRSARRHIGSAMEIR